MRTISQIFESLKSWLFEPLPDNLSPEPDEPGVQGTKEDCTKNDKVSIVIVKPVNFDNVHNICSFIKKGEAVLLNTENMNQQDEQRLLDFLSGVIMVKEGIIIKICQNIYLCSPTEIAVVSEP